MALYGNNGPARAETSSDDPGLELRLHPRWKPRWNLYEPISGGTIYHGQFEGRGGPTRFRTRVYPCTCVVVAERHAYTGGALTQGAHAEK